MPALMQKKMIINGQVVSASKQRTYPLYNPANGEHIADISDGDSIDTNTAIEGAVKAFPSWSKCPAKLRGVKLRKAEQMMLERADDIAHLLTLENGKPFEEAKAEVQFAAGYLGWYAEEGRRVTGEWVPYSKTG